MKKYHKVEAVEINDHYFKLKIDEKKYIFQLEKISCKLKEATNKERNAFIVSSSGYGISWPAIDEDLSIDGLLAIKHKPKFKRNKAS